MMYFRVSGQMEPRKKETVDKSKLFLYDEALEQRKDALQRGSSEDHDQGESSSSRNQQVNNNQG